MTQEKPSRHRGWKAGCLALTCAAILAAASETASAACWFSATSGVGFGSYDVFGTSPVDSTGQFTWRCDILTFPNVRITLTRGASPSYSARQMKCGPETMLYNLFLDTARTQIWGDESEGTSAYYQQYWGFGQYNVNIYGRVPASQDVGVGTYNDTVTIVINF
jgi:spore coat protein U-like protein